MVQEATKALGRPLGRRMVEALQAPDSDWPVWSGKSKASFGWTDAGRDAGITNSTDYAGRVEAEGSYTRSPGSASRTIERAADAISDDSERWTSSSAAACEDFPTPAFRV